MAACRAGAWPSPAWSTFPMITSSTAADSRPERASASLTAAGDVELDASIMDGATLRCGAIAVVKDVRNPVMLARYVMERSEHVLLAGPGASAFAREVGIPAHDNALLVTPRQRERWERLRGQPAAGHG